MTETETKSKGRAITPNKRFAEAVPGAKEKNIINNEKANSSTSMKNPGVKTDKKLLGQTSDEEEQDEQKSTSTPVNKGKGGTSLLQGKAKKIGKESFIVSA
jgi:hypothetical protein